MTCTNCGKPIVPCKVQDEFPGQCLGYAHESGNHNCVEAKKVSNLLDKTLNAFPKE